MFSKAKSKDKDTAKDVKASLAAAEPAQISAPSQSSKRNNQNNKFVVPSIISQDVVIKGSMEANGEVQLEGVLEGDITATALIIGENATVKGDVVCETVTVRGRVEGGIRSRAVTLASSAHIDGDILHSALSVETGAHFEGNCRHSEDPLSEAAAREFRTTKKGAPQRPRPAANLGAEPPKSFEAEEDQPQRNGAAGEHQAFQPKQPRSPLR